MEGGESLVSLFFTPIQQHWYSSSTWQRTQRLFTPGNVDITKDELAL